MEFLQYLRENAHKQDAKTIREAYEILRRAQTVNTMVNATQFSVGDKVYFDSKRGTRVTGVVTKRNRTTVVVKQQGDNVFNGQWRVSPSLLHKV